MKKFLIVLALLGATTAFASDCYSEGIRVGNIQKFSQKGYINKSWEGELVMEGAKTTSVAQKISVSNVWKFSVLNVKVADKINTAVFEGRKVALKYCQVVFAGFETDTPYHVTDVAIRN